MAEKHHVIVGAGTAGINAIRTLRQLGDKGPITLVSAEPPYSRMVLPYYLEQRISDAHATTATPVQLERWGVDCRFGVRPRHLDARGKTLHLDDGESLTFDKLLIATGSSAVRPPVPGADLPGVHSFWTMADARAVHQHIRPEHHVVLIGAGFIAFTILDGLLQRAGKVTIVEVAPRILPRMVDDAGAAIAATWLRARGLTLLTNAKVSALAAQRDQLTVNLAGAPAITADLVLMATGIRPNLEWLADSGVEHGNEGIPVDNTLRTGVPGIYAAGDVAAGPNRVTGAYEVHAIEPTAMEHGRVAGANMAGRHEIAYPGSVLMNIVSVAGLDMASFGSWNDDKAETIIGEAPERHAYRKYVFQGERMVGAIMIGPGSQTWSENDVGMVKGLVQSGQPLGDWKAYLRERPFEIRKPYLASRTTRALMPDTILGAPSISPLT